MSVSGVLPAASHQPSSLHAPHSSGHRHYGGRHAHGLSDIDAQGSSVATAPSPTGKIGSKIDVTA